MAVGSATFVGLTRSAEAILLSADDGDVTSVGGGGYVTSMLIVYVVTLFQTLVYPAQVGVRFFETGRKLSVRDAFRSVDVD